MNIRKRTWTWQGEMSVAWQLDWSDGGKRRQKQFRTRQEAELYRDKLIRERYAREYDVLLESSFPDFLKIYEAKKPRSGSSVGGGEVPLSRYFGKKDSPH